MNIDQRLRLVALLLGGLLIQGCGGGSSESIAPGQSSQPADPEPTYPEPPFIVAGEAVKNADGSTLTLLVTDEPEKGQPYYQKAKQALAGKVFRQAVQVEIIDWDRNEPAVGKVSVDGEYVNAWMVAEGHARVHRKSSGNAKLLELEAAAREAGTGIWARFEPE